MFFSRITEEWKSNFNNKIFRLHFIISIILLAVVLFSLSVFLQFNETREGASVRDPLLSVFSPFDVTWLTFILIYISLIVGIIYLLEHPRQLILAVQSYIVMVFFRITAMYLLPLNPPAGLIPLEDPFVQFFGTGQVLLKDLFFSGHTSTIFLLFLVTKNKPVKILFLISTFLVAVCVIVQHVHYSIDVFAAPFFAFSSYRIVLFFNRILFENT